MSEENQNQEKILTAQEVSDFLKIPLSTLYGLTKQGKLKAVKVGKHWRYTEGDVRRFLENPASVKNLIPSIAPGIN